MRFNAARQQFIAQSVQPDGFLVSLARSCLLSFSSQSTEFDALSSAKPIPGRLSVFSGLTIQTLLRGTIQWHSGGALFVSWGAF